MDNRAHKTQAIATAKNGIIKLTAKYKKPIIVTRGIVHKIKALATGEIAETDPK